MILYSDTGGGHRAAAQAIEQGLKQVEPEVEVRLADPLLQGRSRTVSRLASLYSPIIRYLRPVWGVLYHASNTPPAFSSLRGVFGPTVRNSLEDALEARPDVVLSVHPLLNDVARQAIDELWPGVPLMVVVTDLERFHRGWRFKRADITIVPTADAVADFEKRGIPRDRIRVLGLPVNLRFRPPAPGEREALRRVFGLEQDRFTILVSGGGEGSGHLEEQVHALGDTAANWQLVVVCGRNVRLRRRLLDAQLAVPAAILGFVDNMPDLMRAANLVVGKAGPGAIAEALATGIPIIVTGYIPGQETPNVDYVKRNRIGRYSPKPRELRRTAEEIAAADGVLWREMSARAAELARPYAALEIAHECVGLGTRYRAASQARR